MPYKRRRFNRSRPYPRRGRGRRMPWYSKKYSVGDVASAAWKGVRYLKSMINVEKHLFDQGFASTVSDTGTITHVTAIPQGDAEATRTGNSILAKYISLKGNMNMGASATRTFVRVMIVQDLFNTGTAPTIADILGAVNTFSPVNVDTRDRYVVLRDRTFSLDVAGKGLFTFKWFVRLNFHIKYTGAAGSDEYKNQLYVVLISSEDTNVPSVSYTARLAYFDN